MLSNTSLGLNTRLICLATGMWLALACFAFGGPPPSPFDGLEDAPTPAEREALMKRFRAALPPVSNPITAEQREKLVQRFILTRNPAIVEVLGPELVLQLSERYRDVAVNGGLYQIIRNALIDAVERTDLPEQIKATGRVALLEGLNSPDASLRDDTMTHFAYSEGEVATDALLRMIDDPEEQNRRSALGLLGKFGRPDAAPVIAAKLQQRAKGLDQKAIQNDFTFASGRDAIAQLTARAREAHEGPRPDSTPKPEKVVPGKLPGLVRMAEPSDIFPEPTTPANPDAPAAPPTPERMAPPTTVFPKPSMPANPNPPAAKAPAAVVEHKWPWVIGILTLILIVAVALKRRV